MQFELSPEEKQTLESAHRKERDSRVKDRIKAVLLSSAGWSVEKIFQALRINEATVRMPLNGYVHDRKLKPENGGSISQLKAEQTATLISHLEEKKYVKAVDICTYVKGAYGIEYTVTGMTKWLHRHNFSYKKPMEKHFFKLRNKYSKDTKIHFILDNGYYKKSLETKETAAKYGIVLHYIPLYRPNLNPIERLWKVLNEHVRNNVTFDNPSQFRNKILEFFDVTWVSIKHGMADIINDNFKKIGGNSSC